MLLSPAAKKACNYVTKSLMRKMAMMDLGDGEGGDDSNDETSEEEGADLNAEHLVDAEPGEKSESKPEMMSAEDMPDGEMSEEDISSYLAGPAKDKKVVTARIRMKMKPKMAMKMAPGKSKKG